MKITTNVRNVVLVLVGAAVWVGLSAPNASGQKSKTPEKKPAAATGQGKIWVSESTHREYRIKVEGDTFTSEWVNIPPATAKLGGYIRSECHRNGTRWIGATHALLPCAKSGEATGRITHTCPMTLRFEVDKITPDQITGRGESLRNFDCDTCEVKETGWARYVLVPKRQGRQEGSRQKAGNISE